MLKQAENLCKSPFVEPNLLSKQQHLRGLDSRWMHFNFNIYT